MGSKTRRSQGTFECALLIEVLPSEFHQGQRLWPRSKSGSMAAISTFLPSSIEGLANRGRPSMTSAHASRHLSMSVAQGTWADLPGYCAPTFTLMPVGSTSSRSVQVSGFDDMGHLTPLRRLVSASCSSGQRFASGLLQGRSRPQHPCRSANSSPCRASRGLSPPSKCALPGALPKKAPEVPFYRSPWRGL